ncbi:MAG: response regulator [Acidobacteriaceae bacterium]
MTRRILIADDERMIADTLATIVGLHGFEARTAYDGRQAVETARQWRPHILLTDVLMPVMDGIEAAIAVCRILPDCRVVLLSGVSTIADLAGELEGQGYAFEILRKPMPPEELVACLWKSEDAVEGMRSGGGGRA